MLYYGLNRDAQDGGRRPRTRLTLASATDSPSGSFPVQARGPVKDALTPLKGCSATRLFALFGCEIKFGGRVGHCPRVLNLIHKSHYVHIRLCAGARAPRFSASTSRERKYGGNSALRDSPPAIFMRPADVKMKDSAVIFLGYRHLRFCKRSVDDILGFLQQ